MQPFQVVHSTDALMTGWPAWSRTRPVTIPVAGTGSGLCCALAVVASMRKTNSQRMSLYTRGATSGSALELTL